jgi:hypothetical protein
LVHIADHFVAYYKQFLVGQVEGVMAGWFVDILCLVQVYPKEEHHHNIEDRVRKLKLSDRELENENIEMRENFIKLQSHSMKYNLIFSGILQRDNEKSVYRFLC